MTMRPDLGRCPACGTVVHCDAIVECPSLVCGYQPTASEVIGDV
jgi:hypothetical protein